ncbi:MAG: adenylate/guanylate cyclase domain-containing protein [Myxococcales bacterium]|nr:adenylate/guanylate cyclase domain-containing protein [Myxococcales bacterium]
MTVLPEGSPDPLQNFAQDGFRIEGPLCTPERGWDLVGDTDWLNREAGNGEIVKMALEEQDDGFSLLKGEMAGPVGVRLPFTEIWSSWVAGRFFRQVRDLESPIIARSDYRGELIPAAGGLVRPVIQMTLTGPGWAGSLRKGLALRRMQRQWEHRLARLKLPSGEGEELRDLSEVVAAAFGRWERCADRAVVERFKHHFRSARPQDLAKLRAFELADRWGMGRDTVLDTLLAGVTVSAVELFWSVRCSRCYAPVAGSGMLSDLADHAECVGCKVRTEVDLADNVEVLFTPPPGLATQLDVNFCTVYPKRAPSQTAVFTIAPGQRIESPVYLAPGAWRLGQGHNQPDLDIEVRAEGGTSVEWASSRATAGGQPAVVLKAGEVMIGVSNDSLVRQRVFLSRVGGAVPMVPASLVTTKESFRRQLGHQVLAPDLRVGVRSVALIFTDLSGSTAMYEEIGDALAFAFVRDHFVVLRAASARNGGTVVKTIGDAVMAAFYDAPSAIGGAFDMIEDYNVWVVGAGLENPPALRLGVHVGPALVVHSDQSGLDYFGGTVNFAARAQGAADDGAVVWTEAVHAQDLARRVVGDRGYRFEPMVKSLKGLGDVRLWRGVKLP